MPLYTRTRDAALAQRMAKDVLHKFVGTEVAFYKMQQKESEVNLYMETTEKFYMQPVRIPSFVMVEDKELESDEYSIDAKRNAEFSFIPKDVEDADIYMDEGDVIEYDDKFYEINKVSTTNYWAGRNNKTSIRTQENEKDTTGLQTAIKAYAIQISEKEMHISSMRYGNQENDLDGDVTSLL